VYVCAACLGGLWCVSYVRDGYDRGEVEMLERLHWAWC